MDPSLLFWKKFTFFFGGGDISLSLLLPSLLHITCHVSHDIITPKLREQGPCIFKKLALWADSFYRLKCLYVFVCLSVCLFFRHTVSLRLTVFLLSLSEVQCPNFLDIRNPWGKVMERNGLRFKQFCSKW